MYMCVNALGPRGSAEGALFGSQGPMRAQGARRVPAGCNEGGSGKGRGPVEPLWGPLGSQGDVGPGLTEAPLCACRHLGASFHPQVYNNIST